MSNPSDLTRDKDLLDAFEDCVNRLQVGETSEAALRDYPHYAAILRPMLETVIQVKRAAPNSAEIASAQVRVRDRLAFRKGAPRTQRLPLMRLAALAAVITLVAGLFVFLGRSPDQGGFAAATETSVPASFTPERISSMTPEGRIPPSPSATVTAAPTLSPTPTFTLTASATRTASGTPTNTPSTTFTVSPTFTSTPTITATLTRTRTPAPVVTVTAQVTDDHGGSDDHGDDSGKGDDNSGKGGGGDDDKDDDD
ncbi:MAG: hypothetical protein IAE83_05370 [Anaerolinea sp.]|nr:hypothetical protein [Anaerolinea sp.]MCC6974452.1 hypothetical protein [Anaerolineae bacterium]